MNTLGQAIAKALDVDTWRLVKLYENDDFGNELKSRLEYRKWMRQEQRLTGM